jgi:hypothetical protein
MKIVNERVEQFSLSVLFASRRSPVRASYRCFSFHNVMQYVLGKCYTLYDSVGQETRKDPDLDKQGLSYFSGTFWTVSWTLNAFLLENSFNTPPTAQPHIDFPRNEALN